MKSNKINKKIILYPVLIILALFSLTIFSVSRGSDYIDLTGYYNAAYFIKGHKAYLGYSNQVKVIDLKKGKIINKYSIFDERISYNTYSKSIIVKADNIFLVTYIKSESNSQKEEKYLFWYDIRRKKLIKQIEINGPINIQQLKNKDFILCGDKLIKISEKKVYQIASIDSDEKENITETQKKLTGENMFINSQWSNWLIMPDGKCFTILTLYSNNKSKHILLSTKLFQYVFLKDNYKRKALSGYGIPFSLDEKSKLLEYINNEKLCILDNNENPKKINIYNVNEEKIEKDFKTDYFKNWGIIISDNLDYIYCINITNSDNGINYDDGYSQKNIYQKLNILVIDKKSCEKIKTYEKVFYYEPFNWINLLGINKGIVYLVQDIGLGNEKNLIAVNIWDNKTVNKRLDIKFIPQIMTHDNILMGFDEGNIDDIKIVKIKY